MTVNSANQHRPGRTISHLVGASVLTAILAVGAIACGGDGADSGASPGDGAESPATIGERTARANGCAGCHGENFDGAAGPGWIGLAGSEVTLADGTTTIADTAYLTRAIADPAAEISDGYTLKMPANNLVDSEVAEIVAFIESLATPGSTTAAP